jgi:hypothetical protein
LQAREHFALWFFVCIYDYNIPFPPFVQSKFQLKDLL